MSKIKFLTAISSLSFFVSSCGDEDRVSPSTSATVASTVTAASPPPSPPSASPPKVELQFLVPAYILPTAQTGDWELMTAQLKTGVKITAIFGPQIGPGVRLDPNYKRVVDDFRRAGGVALGYVPTGYAGFNPPNPDSSCKPVPPRTRYNIQDIVDCAKNYTQFYNVDGIFVDEQGLNTESGMNQSQVTQFYKAVFDGIKTFRPNWKVFGNPGAAVSEEFLTTGVTGVADTIVYFEQVAQNYEISPRLGYYNRYPSRRFSAILHSAPNEFDYSRALQEMKKRNTSYIYITDDSGNPYDRLPSNWVQQVQLVKALNTQ